jgi:hypothetical protein
MRFICISPGSTDKHVNCAHTIMFDEKNQNNLIEKYQTSCIMDLSQTWDLHALDFS